MAEAEQGGYKPWSISDFSGGMIDKADNNVIPDNAASDCRNFISETPGKMKRRPGQARLNAADLGGFVQGLHPFYFRTVPTSVINRRLIIAVNGVVKQWSPAHGTIINVKTGLNATADTLFETCVNYVVICNGVDAP